MSGLVARVVREAGERFGKLPAFYAPDDSWVLTYAALDAISDEVAAGLAARGVGAGDVVAIVLPSAPEYVVVQVATAKLGAIVAGVNARLAPTERDQVLALAGPRLVVTTAELAPGDARGHDADDATQRSAAGNVVVVELIAGDGPDDADAAQRMLPALREPSGHAPSEVAPLPELTDDPDRVVAIVFTSGTTGTPKGAVFCERQIDFITQVDTGWRWGDAANGGGHTLGGTSLAHLGPTTKLVGNLVRGAAAHLMARWSAAGALDLVERWRVAGLGGIPTQIALMLRDPTFEARDLSSVQAIVMGGGPATPALVRDARERFGAAVAIRYSCTEAGIGVGTAWTDPPGDAECSVGRAHDGVELSIRSFVVDDGGGDGGGAEGNEGTHDRQHGTLLGVGEVGEVCLRSPATMSGYWRDPDATDATLTDDGAVRTGDLGFVDEDGRLHLAGRAKEMYVRGGYNVYPMAVEAVLAQHPMVAEIAIVPRPDEVMGEIGIAYVVAAPGAEPSRFVGVGFAPDEPLPFVTREDLRAFGAERLAKHELPDEVFLINELPLTPMEKLDRAKLRRYATGQPADG